MTPSGHSRCPCPRRVLLRGQPCAQWRELAVHSASGQSCRKHPRLKMSLLQFQKRFLASSAKNDCNKPSYPLFTTTTAWCGRVGKARHKKMDKTFALPNLHKQSPHLYSILIRRKCPLSRSQSRVAHLQIRRTEEREKDCGR